MPIGPLESGLHCPVCGYNLTGLPEDRCPECGRAFSPADLRFWARTGYDRVNSRRLIYYLFSAPLAFCLLRAGCFLWELPHLVETSGTAMIAVLALYNSIRWTREVLEPERHRQGRLRLSAFVGLFTKAVVMQVVIGIASVAILR